jgi:hypothetical protein
MSDCHIAPADTPIASGGAPHAFTTSTAFRLAHGVRRRKFPPMPPLSSTREFRYERLRGQCAEKALLTSVGYSSASTASVPDRPDWMPRLIWSTTEGPPFDTVCGQLQLRSLNTLGSAPAGAAIGTANPTARAALTRIFDTTKLALRVSWYLGVYESLVSDACQRRCSHVKLQSH